MPSRADAGGADVSKDEMTAAACHLAVELAAAEERGRDEIRQAMRPVSDYDKLAHETWNVWDLDHLMAGEPNEITAAKITARVAAAIRDGEERGRRRGVEAAAKLCMTENETFHTGFYFAKGVLALAPRDSAPITENDVAASCFGVAPRDSGKDET